ncbi:CoA transferase [Rhodospirillales bacterium]|nr:CoA transferase [Rhodospirillales bacterium]
MPRPLEGVRVVGLEQYMAGPYCTLLLADAGAEVIKIERPGLGDPRRQMPPFAEKDGHKKGAGFMGYNRNKKSLALNLRDPKGQEVFKKLCGTADVVVENLRPGSMSKQGLGHIDMRAANPRLIWAIISGFGRMPGYTGPYSDRPAFDIVAESMSGMMNLVGFADKPPSWTIYGLADIISGTMAAYGIMQALYMRERTGEGQMVDSAMFDNMLALNEQMISYYSIAGEIGERGKPKNYYPRGAFEASDGWVALHCPDNILWGRLATAIGHPELKDDARTSTSPARCKHIPMIDALITEYLSHMTRDEAVAALNAAGVPCGSVNRADDVFHDPHVAARKMLIEIDDPKVGAYKFARTTPHMSAAPEPPTNPAPELGEHTRDLLKDLGYAETDIDAMAGADIIGVHKS